MTCTVVDFSKDAIVYNMSGVSREELDNRLNLFFTSQNLRVQKDTPTEKVYQRGTKAGRILLGVFVKYFKVTVAVKGDSSLFSVELRRDMNFIMSGGVVGLQASRKEFERLNEAFKVYFNN